MASASDTAGERTVRTLRRLILTALAFGMLGTLAELILLEHNEDWWQLAPIVLLATGPGAVAWVMVRPTTASVRSMQCLMVLYVLAGLIGIYQHYTGNAEFELEMYPNRGGFELFWESLKGAFPTLAPGAMALFGFLGMAATSGHPQPASEE